VELKRICVFCGSSPGRRPEYRAAAAALGQAMVRRRAGLVFGGGHVGIMGAVADAVLGAGGEAIGVIPRGLQERELAHGGLTRLLVVDTMHQRKATMAEFSDAFIALPGGMGTLEETTEVLTWAQLGIHAKPVGLLDVAGYWAPLVSMLDHAVEEGFLRPDQRALLLVEREVEPLLDRMAAWRPAPVRRWMERDQT